MVQILRDLGIEWVAANPGSSFEGIQESIINYGTPPNVKPEFITALHEESSVTMGHGYGKATGKPMCALFTGRLASSTRRCRSTRRITTVRPCS